MGSVPFVRSAVLKRAADPSEATVRVPRTTSAESDALTAFLLMNPEEKFDLEAINAIDPQTLVAGTHGDRRVLREVLRTAESLMPRVRAETEDPLLVSAILRKKTMDWHLHSAVDPDWADSTPVRWGGIFYESRVPGGRLSRKLSVRLNTLINQCVAASGTVATLRAGVTGIFRGSVMMAKTVQFGLGTKRPRLTQQVAQAYLDDLAASGRNGDQPLPLERLSDLARRNGGPEVNITLSELFHQDVAGVFIVLDPRFHPGMCALSIRVVPPKATEDASTYDLVQGNAHPASASGAPDAAEGGSPDSPWERDGITQRDWLAHLKALEKRKARLEPPPRENPRDRESYLGLRELLLTDSTARKTFLVVHWKGRPAGLPLLCRLLSDGALTPEVETDGDYLEAELNHPDRGRADRRSKDGQWDLGHGWTVGREFTEDHVRVYRAQGKSAD